MADKKQGYSRRTKALFWCGMVAVVIGVLIYMEQIPMLYVLATVGLVLLLVVVGFSDLEKVGRDSMDTFAADKD